MKNKIPPHLPLTCLSAPLEENFIEQWIPDYFDNK